MGREGAYLNIVKAIYDKPIANIILNGEKLKAFLLNQEQDRVATFATVIQHSSGSPSYSNRRRKRNKGIQIGKEEVKFSLFADDIILYIQNPKNSIRKLLELISEFSKAAGYKINTQELLAFLYLHLFLKNQKEKGRNQFHSPLQQKE